MTEDTFPALDQGAPATAPDCFIDVPEDVYHAEGRRGRYLQSHALALFAQSPAAYDRARRGVAGSSDKPSEAFAFGRAAHCRILEGPVEFSRRFATDQDRPINPKTNKPFGSATKEYAAWAASLAPREIVSCSDVDTIWNMNYAVHEHEAAGPLFEDGRAEATVRTRMAGLDCQIRIDWFSPAHGIVDLKTCRDLDRFEWDALSFGYIHQLAFYHAVLKQASGRDVPCRIVAVEKAEPFRCGVWRLPDWTVERAERENLGRMERLRECIEADYWPEPAAWQSERTLDFRD